MKTINPIEAKLQQLRQDWKIYPGRREVIEVVAKSLKRQLKDLKDFKEREQLVKKILL